MIDVTKLKVFNKCPRLLEEFKNYKYIKSNVKYKSMSQLDEDCYKMILYWINKL